jgi:hypothetical protein
MKSVLETIGDSLCLISLGLFCFFVFLRLGYDDAVYTWRINS